MNSLNMVQLVGNVTADPEIKETPSGQKVANFSIATNRKWTDASGMKQEDVEFHNIVIWGKLAEIVEQYVTKGKKLYLQGRNKTRSWDDEEHDCKRYKTEIVCDSMIILNGGSGDRSEGSDEQESFGDAPAPKKPAKKKAAPIEDIQIEDILF